MCEPFLVLDCLIKNNSKSWGNSTTRREISLVAQPRGAGNKCVPCGSRGIFIPLCHVPNLAFDWVYRRTVCHLPLYTRGRIFSALSPDLKNEKYNSGVRTYISSLTIIVLVKCLNPHNPLMTSWRFSDVLLCWFYTLLLLTDYCTFCFNNSYMFLWYVVKNLSYITWNKFKTKKGVKNSTG